MAIPLAIFYYVYIGFAVVFLLFSIISIYHLLKYSHMNIVAISVVLVYLFFSATIFTISSNYTGKVDWTQNVSIISSFEQSNKSGLEL